MNERLVRSALAAVLFVYVLTIRTYDVATTFLMLGEQTRDWAIALGGITDLPLVGAPSTAGGRGLGPAYYYLLWLGRVTIGPFMDNLPHVGGITVALLQSIADAWLFVALSSRVPWSLALATCLLIASGPFDIAISSVIWNPPVAAALIKMSAASALMLDPKGPAWKLAVPAVLAWAAVQTHLSAAFPALAILGGVALAIRKLTPIAIMTGAIAVMQIPFAWSILSEPGAPAGPTTAIASITSGQSFRPFFGLDTVTGVTGNLFLPMPDSFKFWIPAVVCGAIVVARYRRDPAVIGVSIGGIAVAAAIFSTWTRSYDGYWFLTMTTGLALTFAFTIAALPWRPVVLGIGVVLIGLFAAWQPARIEDSKKYFEYPQYGTMVRGSTELIMKAPAVRDIKVGFDVHPTMNRHFIYTILGGRIDTNALYTAVIQADGTVELQ